MICTTILRKGNILDGWKLLSMPENMNKFHLDNVYNCVSNVMSLVCYFHCASCCLCLGSCYHERFTRRRCLLS